MTLEELEDNEDEFGEDDEAAIEMYRWVEIMQVDNSQSCVLYCYSVWRAFLKTSF